MSSSQSTSRSQKIAADFMQELRLVTWPTKAQTIRLTGVVIGISLIIGLYIGIIDGLLAAGLSFLTSLR